MNLDQLEDNLKIFTNNQQNPQQRSNNNLYYYESLADLANIGYGDE